MKFNSAQFVEPNEYTKAEKGKVLEITFSAKNNGKKDAYLGTEERQVADAGGIMMTIEAIGGLMGIFLKDKDAASA